MEETEKTTRKNIILSYVLIFAVCILACAGSYLIYGINDIRAVQMGSLCILGLLVCIFSFNAGRAYDRLYGGNADHPGRFYLVFALMMAATAVLPAMPAATWPMVIIYVLLTILSNIPTGICAGSICLFIAVMSGGSSAYTYAYVYLFCGIAASVLISHIDEEFRTTLPVLTIEIMLLFGLSVNIITTASGLSIELLIYPVVNVTITLIFLLFILKLYSARVVFKLKDNYLELNDPECMLLTKMKNISPEDYHKTIHVVYFCDRLSSVLNLNGDVVKCAGLYHRVGVIGGAYNWANTRMICEESNIPAEVMEILEEFEDDSVPMRRAETAVLYMCDSVVSSVQYLFAKNPEMKIDYPALIEAIFKQRLDTGCFKSNAISLDQLEKMKHVFMEEKLYYDFLR